MENPPDSTMMTVTTTVTTLSIETSIHTTIVSDCGPGSGSVAEVGAASEHEDESDREAAGSQFRPGVRN
jgi:putative (di)nucleoside polyphosphate hydrolase